ncbi:UNVERIFIED_ORG: hypothetical protein L601_000300000260 [Gordonia westfalica J30]
MRQQGPPNTGLNRGPSLGGPQLEPRPTGLAGGRELFETASARFHMEPRQCARRCREACRCPTPCATSGGCSSNRGGSLSEVIEDPVPWTRGSATDFKSGEPAVSVTLEVMHVRQGSYRQFVDGRDATDRLGPPRWTPTIATSAVSASDKSWVRRPRWRQAGGIILPGRQQLDTQTRAVLSETPPRAYPSDSREPSVMHSTRNPGRE